jgi:receptor protein-tyrosine kinase
MSVDPATDNVRELNDELSEVLITQWRLSSEEVERIRETMRSAHLSFAEAARHIGLVTPEQIVATIEWVRDRAPARTLSVVEVAIHREKSGHSVVVRHAGQVKPGIHLVLARDPDNPRCEQLRALRTELLLLLSANGNRSNVIALVSPCPEEGRSQLSAELAIAFAQLGRCTLLVDADFRRPRQHALFEADNLWGLTQSLAYGEPLPLHSVEGLPHLSLLTSGPTPSNPLELLSDGRFDRLMRQWRNKFDFVVIDTPPLTKYSDALAIATLAGGVLVVNRAETTTHKDMQDLLRRLASTQARTLGAVLNRF